MLAGEAASHGLEARLALVYVDVQQQQEPGYHEVAPNAPNLAVNSPAYACYRVGSKDGYLRRGLLAVDPRSDLDPSTCELLERLAEIRRERPDRRIGMRLSGPVSDEIAAHLHELGFRLFAVDPDELRVARLALGKAAWA